MLLHKSVVHDTRVRREAATLAAAGHAVTVLELDQDARGTLDGFARASVTPPAWVRRALPFHVYRVAFLAVFVAQILRARPDVVHAHDAAMLLPGLLGARLTGARLVYDSHELATGVPYRDGAWARFVAGIERLAVPRASAVMTVSEGIAEQIQKRYGLARRPTVVRNVCALPPAPRTGELRRCVGIGDAPMILHQGATAPDRGCEVLVRAVTAVPGAHLVFLGDEGHPGFNATLASLAHSLDVTDRVHFAPSVQPERLLGVTAEADVGVSLLQDTCENHRLALPNKVFEYVAAGVPVVVSDLPELARLIDRHPIGETVPAHDPSAVAAGIRRQLAPGAKAAAEQPLREAAAALSWIRERTRLTDLYGVLAAEMPPPR
jgi:glycosyltransferase involved in cell wall biosynthesis